jgi:hypothetical protein
MPTPLAMTFCTNLVRGDVAAVSATLDRLLHHGYMLKCGLVGRGSFAPE